MNISIKQMDAFLADLESAKDDDDLRRMFELYPEKYDTNTPDDPFSQEYRDKQFALYEQISGREYSPKNEVSPFDVAEAAIRPFPYRHMSSELVGNQLLAMGFLIKTMGLAPGARILEFGPGWGNTTLILAKMGYKVTAIDIEKNFVDLIKKRASMEGLNLDIYQNDFSFIEEIEGQFDAILFFECFHHAQDHMRIMAGFDRVLKPGGIVCFGAEPIVEDFPIPWGLRMDGQSIWAIRKNGWLELGFNSHYFSEALKRNGFVGTEYIGSDGPWSKAIIAERIVDRKEQRYLLTFEGGGLHTQVGTLGEDGLFIGRKDTGIAVYGPYLEINAGFWRVEIVFSGSKQRSGIFSLEIVADCGNITVRPSEIFEIPNSEGNLCVDFVSKTKIQNLEIRIFVSGECEATIQQIVLERI